MAIDVTTETDQIQQQFVQNRGVALQGLLKNPEPYIVGHADALGIPFQAAAKLVAHGMASMLRDLAMKQLQLRLDQEATTKPTPEKVQA